MMSKNKKQDKKKAGLILSVIILIAAVGVIGMTCFSRDEKDEILYKETQVKRGNLTVGITESGSVSVGTVAQDLEELADFMSTGGQNSVSNTSTQMSGGTAAAGTTIASQSSAGSAASMALEVEEVYLTVGAEAKVGDPILKLTAESVAEYKEALEEEVSSAELALKKAEFNAKSSKLTAQYTYNANVTKGTVAQSEYDTTVAELQASVDAAQVSVNNSAAKIADYQKRIKKGEKCSAALAEEQLNYNALVNKLQSAQNTQTTRTVEARQKYEEAILKYNNADKLYQIDTFGLDTEVEEAKEALEDAQAALTGFQSLIGDGTIYTQYAGTVTAIGYTAGDEVSALTEVAAYKDEDEVTMKVSVSQEDISAIQVGNPVEIALTAYPDKTYEGQVKAVDTSASSGTSIVSYDVTVVFIGDVSDVYQDMTGNVTFIASQAKDVCYVSQKAIIMENQNTYVKRKREDETIEKIQVTTGISDGVNIEISDGINQGDTVVIESQVRPE